MMTKHKRSLFTALLVLSGLLHGAQARELFEGEKAPTFTRGQSIYADDQIGGYQIYNGGDYWQFEDARVSTSGGNADSIPIGVIRMTYWDAGSIAATQTIAANLRSNNGAYWSGSPCDGDSLAKRNRARGRYDDCMTIKAESTTVGSKLETFLVTNTVQSQTGGRYYIGTVSVNVAYLGFPGSTVVEWNKLAVQSDPAKSAALAKLLSWAERYQDAVAAQMDYKRPADTFAGVPKLRDLKVATVGVPTATQRPAVNPKKGASYVFCEDTKTMVLEGSGECRSDTAPLPESSGKTVEKRLQELKDLLGKGLIDKDAYQRKRDEILKSL